VQNATCSPSGEKNGVSPVSPSGMRLASSRSRSRTKSPPTESAPYAMWAPSGETATVWNASAYTPLSTRGNRLTAAGSRGRSQPQAARPPKKTASTAIAIVKRRRCCESHAPDSPTAAVRAPRAAMSDGCETASAKGAALANRSAGSFSSAMSTAASMWGGTVWRWEMSGRGVSVTTFATIACAVGPVNGGSPTSISYSTAPKAYTSLRAVSSRSPIACSGLM
jgi:hypothetical protein